VVYTDVDDIPDHVDGSLVIDVRAAIWLVAVLVI
jgi:hypothetical protein